MIEFKPITIEDKDILDPYLKNNPYMACDYSFTNLFIWRKKYHTCYTILDGFAVLCSEDGYFLMPVGQGDIKGVIKKLCQYARQRNWAPTFASVTPKAQEILDRFFPGKFEYVHSLDRDDYLYLSEDLIYLKGKKYHAKRNHINKFGMMYSDYECVIPTQEDLLECFEVYKKWCEESYGRYDPDTDESIAMREALLNADQLKFCSMAIKVAGKIVAFSIGQPLNSEVFDVNVEKALFDYREAYAVINRCFAHNCASKYRYVNREEDMGIEGLRKAKLSYNPAIVLQKSIAIFRGEL